MKLRNEIEKMNKDIVFNIYTKIVEDFKEFEDIDNKSMVEEIINIYKDYENIIDICTYYELEYLNEILKKKGKTEEKYIEIESNLLEKFLIFYDGEKKVVPEELQDAVKKAIKKVDKKEKAAIDALNDTIVGIIKTYGILSPEKICEILENKMEIRKEVVEYQLENSRYIKFYAYKIYYDKKEYYMFEPYYTFEEDLVYTLETYTDLEYADVSLEDIIENRFHIFNLNKESIRNFLEKIETYKFNPTELYLKIIEYSVLDLKREDLIDFMLSIKELKKCNKEELTDLLERAMNDMPSAALKGHTPNELMQKKIKEEYDERYKKTYENTKENENIQDYKALREETNEMFGEAARYLMQNHYEQIQKLTNVAIQNEFTRKLEESNILNNLILFHSINEEESLFSLYIKKGMNILSKQYRIACLVEESYTESLFQVKKLIPKEGKVRLIDTKTKKEYEIYDLAFSSGNKTMEGSHIYTTLLTVNKITYANEYAFIFPKELHKDIESEIKQLKKTIKNVENESTKEFLACYKLFKKEDIVFTARPLE